MTPQEQQALYEANVLKIAEDMAASSIERMHVNGDYEVGKMVAVGFYKAAARIALKHMAEEVEFIMNGKFLWSTIQMHLQSRGLVPAKSES